MIKFLLICVLGIAPLSAQLNIYGIPGFVFTPSAELLNDGGLAISGTVINKKYARPRGIENLNHLTAVGFTLSFLPRFEISLRLTQRYKVADSFGDRNINARFLLKKEGKYFPSVVLGLHDVYSKGGFFKKSTASFNNAYYLVLGKRFFQNEKRQGILCNIGYSYAHTIKKKNIKHYYLDGFFMGLSYSPHKTVVFLVDYDTDKFSGGVRFELFNRVNILLSAPGFTSFGAMVGGVFNLK